MSRLSGNLPKGHTSTKDIMELVDLNKNSSLDLETFTNTKDILDFLEGIGLQNKKGARYNLNHPFDSDIMRNSGGQRNIQFVNNLAK